MPDNVNDAAMQRMKQQLDEQKRNERATAPQFTAEQIAQMRPIIAADTERTVKEVIPGIVGNDPEVIENTRKRSAKTMAEWGKAIEDL